MKIVVVHNRYRDAGGEDVVFESEKRLLERAGHQVVPYERSNGELRDGSPLDRVAIALRMVWSWETRTEFAAILDEVRPDIVHVHNTFMLMSPSIFSACSQRKTPVVQTLHNFQLFCPGGNLFRHGMICRECVDQNLLRGVRHACYRDSRGATAAVALMLASHRTLQTYEKSVTRFITLTKFAKEQFVAAGFPADRFAVKPNFVDRDPGKRSRQGDYALYVGRLFGNKGVHVLLNAWKILRPQYPLQIVGDGPERAALEEEVRRCGLSGITFRGQLSRDQVMETIKGARFTIVPSIMHESFGMCVVESFACGTPVLCSRLGSLAELVDDHVTGLHFNAGDDRDLANKVTWAWNHPSELEPMGHAARASYETTYSAETNYSLLMDIYEQALATAGRPPSIAPVAPVHGRQFGGRRNPTAVGDNH